MSSCIDLFAGPGGLGEGFTRAGFEIAISIEKETVECQTLLVRKIYKLLISSGRKEHAKQLETGDIDIEQVKSLFPRLFLKAKSRVTQLELGKAPFSNVFECISNSLARKNEPLILLGGPPCQAYSVVGRSRNIGRLSVKNNPEAIAEFYRDSRHLLYREYLKVLSVFKPDVFIMENVKGILSARTEPATEKGSVIQKIIEDLQDPYAAMSGDNKFLNEINTLGEKLSPSNYVLVPLIENRNGDLLTTVDQQPQPSDFLIRCERYGVPQARHRVIICGIRSDVFRRLGKPGFLKHRQDMVTVRDVIGSMPRLRSEITREEIKASSWSERVTKEISDLAAIQKPRIIKNRPTASTPKKAEVKNNPDLSDFLEDSIETITNHKTRSHMASDLARYYFCADFAENNGRSPKLEDWPTGKLAPQHRNIRNQGNRLTASGFSDRFKVQVWDKPCSTITSHISKDGHYFIHPDKSQCRSLSVREAARIQTFPDSYQFCGGISKQFHQIGNAVPPFLAYQIALLIKEYLDQ